MANCRVRQQRQNDLNLFRSEYETLKQSSEESQNDGLSMEGEHELIED